MQLFEQKKSDGRWTRASFLRQIFSKIELFSKILAFLESAQWAGWKNGLTFLIWWTLSFDLFLARARQLKSVYYHSLTHLRLFSMLSDVKLGHFEVITPQQYNGYPWCDVASSSLSAFWSAKLGTNQLDRVLMSLEPNRDFDRVGQSILYTYQQLLPGASKSCCKTLALICLCSDRAPKYTQSRMEIKTDKWFIVLA